MNTVPTGFRGLTILQNPSHRDERGISRKVVTSEWLAAAGLDPNIAEVLMTTNIQAGTVRGLHYQVEPVAESKSLWVTQGSIWDVVVDLRPDEPTYGHWYTMTLSADDDVALHIPQGFAHGYQTLEDDTHLTYLISTRYSPEHARTLRWDDPQLAIKWPLPVTVMSASDQRGHAWPTAR